uniref:basic proline-rich protein-like n=1 Tax=Nyctereutes procyonoides TaxID=34880 RepID=UPI0024442E74|nr:basic proline-rich protein-like [Nyctereutes procyonoides]
MIQTAVWARGRAARQGSGAQSPPTPSRAPRPPVPALHRDGRPPPRAKGGDSWACKPRKPSAGALSAPTTRENQLGGRGTSTRTEPARLVGKTHGEASGPAAPGFAGAPETPAAKEEAVGLDWVTRPPPGRWDRREQSSALGLKPRRAQDTGAPGPEGDRRPAGPGLHRSRQRPSPQPGRSPRAPADGRNPCQDQWFPGPGRGDENVLELREVAGADPGSTQSRHPVRVDRRAAAARDLDVEGIARCPPRAGTQPGSPPRGPAACWARRPVRTPGPTARWVAGAGGRSPARRCRAGARGAGGGPCGEAAPRRQAVLQRHRVAARGSPLQARRRPPSSKDMAPPRPPATASRLQPPRRSQPPAVQTSQGRFPSPVPPRMPAPGPPQAHPQARSSVHGTPDRDPWQRLTRPRAPSALRLYRSHHPGSAPAGPTAHTQVRGPRASGGTVVSTCVERPPRGPALPPRTGPLRAPQPGSANQPPAPPAATADWPLEGGQSERGWRMCSSPGNHMACEGLGSRVVLANVAKRVCDCRPRCSRGRVLGARAAAAQQRGGRRPLDYGPRRVSAARPAQSLETAEDGDGEEGLCPPPPSLSLPPQSPAASPGALLPVGDSPSPSVEDVMAGRAPRPEQAAQCGNAGPGRGQNHPAPPDVPNRVLRLPWPSQVQGGRERGQDGPSDRPPPHRVTSPLRWWLRP